MTVEEIERIVEVASTLGIKHLKITGGEPLLREDILEIIQSIRPYMTDISMTTNGVLLNNYGTRLSEAGLNRINISLDTLNKDTFKFLTGREQFSEVINGINSISGNGLSPIKLNMVLMKGVNEDELPDMLKFTMDVGGILQVIELETTRECIDSEIYSRFHSDLQPLECWLGDHAVEVRSRLMHHRQKYRVPLNELNLPVRESCEQPEPNGSTAEVELVRPMHNSEFCGNCTRLRITSDGKLKPCLLNDGDLVDILTPLRNGAGTEQLEKLFMQAVENREPYWM